jgi:hypothetical protein
MESVGRRLGALRYRSLLRGRREIEEGGGGSFNPDSLAKLWQDAEASELAAPHVSGKSTSFVILT